MGVPPGNRRELVPRDYLNGTSQGEPVLSLSKEHPRTPGKTAISVVAASNSCNIRAGPTRSEVESQKSVLIMNTDNEYRRDS